MARKQVEVGRQAPLIRRIASAVVAFLILFYIGYQIWSANYQSIRFETANWATVADSFQTTGYAIRQETLITQDNTQGVVGYRLEDGEKISQGGAVADIFSSEDAAAAVQQSEQLEAEIQRLESLDDRGNTYAQDIQQIDERLDQALQELMEAVQSRDTGAIAQAREEAAYQISQRQIATGENVDYTSRLESLKAQKQELDQQASAVSGQITAPTSGYFSSTTDGWEQVFDYDSALELTPEDLQKEYEPQETPENVVGKITGEFNWYFACVVDAGTALKLQESQEVELSLPFATTEKISATIAAINQPDLEGDAAVILECRTMNSMLANIRQETVQVDIRSYSGVLVSQQAIHFETVEETVTDANGKERTVTHENVMGVYVRSGGQLHFVQVFSDISVNGYAVCYTNLQEPGKEYLLEQLVTDETIQLNDEVAVEGKDLYDGKVV